MKLRLTVAAAVVGMVVAGGAVGPAPSAAPAAVLTATTAHVRPVTRVVVVDDTPGAWAGVGRAIRGWNTSPLIHITRAKSCTPGVYCVYLDAFDQGDTQWLGQTSRLDPWHAHVQFNTHYAKTGREAAAVVCHELGHTLGIPHPTRAEIAHHPHVAGCIGGTDPDLTTPAASPADLAALTYVALNPGRGQRWGALSTEARR